MRPNWKIILVLTAILIFAFSVALAWSAPQKAATPVFTLAERDAIQADYLHLNYKLGNHVLLVRMADLTIIDIFKNGGLK